MASINPFESINPLEFAESNDSSIESSSAARTSSSGVFVFSANDRRADRTRASTRTRDDDQYDDEDDIDQPPLPMDASLSWRLDEQLSLSDWTIEVDTISSQEPPRIAVGPDEITGSLVTVNRTYHVHKCILAVGPKKSDYFLSLFQRHNDKDGGFAESASATSRIELEEIAASAFPVMLDYLYSRNDTIHLTTQNATALHYLGDYFGIRRLSHEAKKYWRSNMSTSNIHIYYEHALVLKNEQIMSAVKRVCVGNLLQIQSDAPILGLADETFLLEILQAQPGSHSQHKSILVSAFLFQQRSRADDMIKTETFLALTSESVLPVIDFEATKILLNVEAETVVESGSGLSSLETRCIRSLSEDWKTILKESKNDEDKDDGDAKMLHFLTKRKPAVLAKLLFSCLDCCNRELNAASKTTPHRSDVRSEEEIRFRCGAEEEIRFDFLQRSRQSSQPSRFSHSFGPAL